MATFKRLYKSTVTTITFKKNYCTILKVENHCMLIQELTITKTSHQVSMQFQTEMPQRQGHIMPQRKGHKMPQREGHKMPQRQGHKDTSIHKQLYFKYILKNQLEDNSSHCACYLVFYQSSMSHFTIQTQISHAWLAYVMYYNKKFV